MPKKLIVIGGNGAGLSAASTAKRAVRDLEVEVFEAGSNVSYANCGMPYFIGGVVSRMDELFAVRLDDLINKRGLKVRIRHRVEKIDVAAKIVSVRDLDAGRVFEAGYDDLVITTGAAPIAPEGVDFSLPGVFTLRGLEEAVRIRSFIEERGPKRAVVVGSGFIGLEMAEALAARGMAVTVIELRERVMPAMEPEISAVIAAELADKGVTVVTGQSASEIKAEAGGILVKLSGGESLDADLALFGLGVAPDNRWLAGTGIELGIRGAIKVDRRQRTTAPGVWAAGDCAEVWHRLLQKNVYIPLALPANRAGRVIGANLVGGDEEFPGVLGSAEFKCFDLSVARTGLGLEEGRAAGLDLVKSVISDGSRPHYYPGGAEMQVVMIVERGTKKLYGAQMAGRDGVGHRINIVAATLAAGFTLDQIYDLDLAYAPPFSQVWDPILNAAKVAMKAK